MLAKIQLLSRRLVWWPDMASFIPWLLEIFDKKIPCFFFLPQTHIQIVIYSNGVSKSFCRNSLLTILTQYFVQNPRVHLIFFNEIGRLHLHRKIPGALWSCRPRRIGVSPKPPKDARSEFASAEIGRPKLVLLRNHWVHMGVSKNRGFSPQIMNFKRGFPLFSPSILGYHYFWKHPYTRWAPSLVINGVMGPLYCARAASVSRPASRRPIWGPYKWPS